MLNGRGRARHGNQRGQAMVLFAILLPLIMMIGSFVITVGNWWVHKRHLQTQVDAAAFAGGTEFWGCASLLDPTTANKAIKARALEYAGDFLRPPSSIDPLFSGPVRNPQVQQPDDVRVVLNSATWWSQANPSTDGTGYDDTIDLDGDPLTPGDPCSTKSLDVKATDDEAPTLWGWLPFVASPKTKARVEIRQVVEMSGMLPFAVPEIDPAAVVALFVNEDAPAGSAIVDWQRLIEQDDPSLPWSEWVTPVAEESTVINRPNTGVVILVSKNDPMPGVSADLDATCNPPGGAGLIKCYGGAAPTSGISFIHGYDGQNGTLSNPVVKSVSLYPIGCTTPPDYSAPYFTNQGDCSAEVRAEIDFGPGAASPPTAAPTCAIVEASPGGTMTWTGSYWSTTINLPAASGRTVVDIDWWSGERPPPPPGGGCGNKNQHPNRGTFSKVAAPYVADDASGPIEYLQLLAFTGPGGTGTPLIPANSVEYNSNTKYYSVTVGVKKPLQIIPPTDPPLLLRFASKSGSLNQALDCDAGIVFVDEIADGCRTRYRLNYYDWDGDGPNGTPYTWQDILCTAYPSPSDLPPPWFVPPPGEVAPNCVAAKTGDVVAMRQGLFERFQTNPNAPAGANGCYENNWPQVSADIPAWIASGGPASDPRYITLIITDITASTGQGAENEPVKYFGGFYAVGWDIGPAGGGNQTGCPTLAGWDGNAPHPLGLSAERDNGDVWGYFINFVVPLEADPSDTLCNFDEIGTCVAVLVE